MPTPSPRAKATKEALVKTAFALVYIRRAWTEWYDEYRRAKAQR